MHTLHFDPRQRLLIGLVALNVALLFVLFAAAPLGRLDTASDHGSSAATRVGVPTPAPRVIRRNAPLWITEPLASPLESLLRPARG
jgi:hypothetical protein